MPNPGILGYRCEMPLEGFWGHTHQNSSCQWGKKQRWGKEDAEAQYNCDRGPGQSCREFLELQEPCGRFPAWARRPSPP